MSRCLLGGSNKGSLHEPRPPNREANAVITRVWVPADGPVALLEIARLVLASGGTLIARIPAIALTPDDLTSTGTRRTGAPRIVPGAPSR